MWTVTKGTHVVLEIVDGMYKLGTKLGRLATLYSRNQLQPCHQKFIAVCDVPDKEISLQSTAIFGYWPRSCSLQMRVNVRTTHVPAEKIVCFAILDTSCANKCNVN